MAGVIFWRRPIFIIELKFFFAHKPFRSLANKKQDSALSICLQIQLSLGYIIKNCLFV